MFAGPGRHGDRHRRDGSSGGGPKLEPGADRNGEADTGFERNDLFAIALLSPHVALAGQDEPDLFDGAVNHGMRDLARSEFEVSHAACRQAEKDSHQ